MENKEQIQKFLKKVFECFTKTIYMKGPHSHLCGLWEGQIQGYVLGIKNGQCITDDQASRIFDIKDTIREAYFQMLESGEEVYPLKTAQMIGKYCQYASEEIQKILGE